MECESGGSLIGRAEADIRESRGILQSIEQSDGAFASPEGEWQGASSAKRDFHDHEKAIGDTIRGLSPDGTSRHTSAISDPKQVRSADADEDFSDDISFDDIYRRRHVVESDGSNYEPSDAEGEQGEKPDDFEGEGSDIASELAVEYAEIGARIVKPEPLSDDETPLNFVPPVSPEPSLESPGPSRKRTYDSAFPEDRVVRSAKGSVNQQYLDLLNQEIEDARLRFVPQENFPLHSQQIGLIFWTSAEKDLFFEAISRLGIDDVSGIAKRIGSKGELEVTQYLRLLQDGLEVRKGAKGLEKLEPMDFPAAFEISHACCAKLEEAADTIAVRQENYEDAREVTRWGKHWLITPFNYVDIEKAQTMVQREDSDMPWMKSAALFDLHNWLELSGRIFMNASFPDGNWHFISEDPPAIRATALEDMFSVAVSITKRLVAASIYVAGSRIRARKQWKAHTYNAVRVRDVMAAALSIGIPTNSHDFWAKSARRLRLNVYEEDDDSGDDAMLIPEGDGLSEDPEAMPYEDVERALGLSAEECRQTPSSDESDDDVDMAEPDASSDKDSAQSDGEQQSENETDAEPRLDAVDSDVEAEANELLQFTALHHPISTRFRNAVLARVKTERDHEAYAKALDSRASFGEEKQLWAMLGHQKPKDLVKVPIPERPPPRTAHDIEEMMPSRRRDWRNGLQLTSEWETRLERADGEENEDGLSRDG